MLGLDIGTYSIKAVELQKKDNTFTLVNFKIQERTAYSKDEVLSTVLKKFLDEGHFGSKELYIAVSGNLVVVRLVELPEMAGEELKNAIRFEAEKYTPFSIDDAIVDYQVVAKDPQTKKTRVLLAAVRNDVVKNYIDAISRLGFVVKGVDVDGIAIANAFLNSHQLKKQEGGDGEAAALLNIGDAYLNMSVVYQDIPFVIRDISAAGAELAENIAEGLGLDKSAAYQLKQSPPPDKQEGMLEVIRPSLSKLAREIRLSLGYFENQFAKGVDAIYLSGGSSRLFGLKEFLSESLDVKVESWDPFSSVKISEGASNMPPDEVKAVLAVAVGLAIRE